MPKMRLRPGLCPGSPASRWGSLQGSTRPLGGFKGPNSKERGQQRSRGEEREGEGKGKEGARGENGWGTGEGKGRGHTVTSFSPLQALTRLSYLT